ncbi:MAG: endolytic transglycosylase MltG [Bacteroidales bacterium]|nr:endolytic transglycosylase MltG [Bacteroidales bacterium]
MLITKRLKITLIIILALIITGISIIIVGYKLFLAPAMLIPEGEFVHIYIRTGWNFNETMQMLEEEKLLRHPKAFKKLADFKKYNQRIRPGRYKVTHGMSNKDLVALLRSGNQDPVNVVFNNIRTPQQLAGRIAKQLEADSVSLVSAFLNSSNHEKYGIPEHQLAMMFIPNTYEFFWNTTAEGFMERMHKEYEAFWNSHRLERLKAINFSKAAAVTLASIIEMETRMHDEKTKIAGVYMNRLRIGMRLQADPTLVFAHGDFTMRRVLNRHKQIDSPYNTYRYAGLPPGPISYPSISSIDAVLNYETHDYLYFAARDDFSGYHSFARTYQQHLVNARKYHRALNERNIR